MLGSARLRVAESFERRPRLNGVTRSRFAALRSRLPRLQAVAAFWSCSAFLASPTRAAGAGKAPRSVRRYLSGYCPNPTAAFRDPAERVALRSFDRRATEGTTTRRDAGREPKAARGRVDCRGGDGRVGFGTPRQHRARSAIGFPAREVSPTFDRGVLSLDVAISPSSKPKALGKPESQADRGLRNRDSSAAQQRATVGHLSTTLGSVARFLQWNFQRAARQRGFPHARTCCQCRRLADSRMRRTSPLSSREGPPDAPAKPRQEAGKRGGNSAKCAAREAEGDSARIRFDVARRRTTPEARCRP
jgi:hypothetical protein